MAIVGKFNKLKICKEVDFGLYLDGGEDGEILLPTRYVPEKYDVGEEIDVFIYFDSEDRIIATTLQPFAQVGEFAFLRVVSVTNVGAFFDWGLAKDLFVPFREQAQRLEIGKWYIVYILIDQETRRVMASTKTDKYLDNLPPQYTVSQEVDLLVYTKTDIGYKVIINGMHTGIVYFNEVFQELSTGQKLKGYIKKVREDEKIDVSVYKPGYSKVNDELENILQKLKENNGFLPVSDSSPSEEIQQLFGISKKTFKKAIGALYKEKQIVILEKGIKLVI